MLVASIKSLLKSSPLYPYYFSRKNTLPLELNNEELRYAQLYASFVGEGSYVLDIGANIGSRVKVFRHLGCRVVAVEPQRACAAALRRTFGDSITVIQAGVSDRAGTAELSTSDVTQIASFSNDWMVATRQSGRFDGIKWDRKERVKLVTLDALLMRYGMPDFVKIDIEGHELTVLRALTAPVKALSFEFTPEIRENGIACVEHMETIYTYEFNFSANETGALMLPEWMGRDAIIDFLRTTNGYGDVYARRFIPTWPPQG